MTRLKQRQMSFYSSVKTKHFCLVTKLRSLHRVTAFVNLSNILNRPVKSTSSAANHTRYSTRIDLLFVSLAKESSTRFLHLSIATYRSFSQQGHRVVNNSRKLQQSSSRKTSMRKQSVYAFNVLGLARLAKKATKQSESSRYCVRIL